MKLFKITIISLGLIIVSLLIIPQITSPIYAGCACEVSWCSYPCGVATCHGWCEGCSDPGNCTPSDCEPHYYSCSTGCCPEGTPDPGDGGYDVCRPRCPAPLTPTNNAVLDSADPVNLSWQYQWSYDSHTNAGGYYWCRGRHDNDSIFNNLVINKLFPGPNNLPIVQQVVSSEVHTQGTDPPTSFTYNPGAGYAKLLTYDDQNLNKTGSWQSFANANLINGTGATTSQNGSTATLGFDGEGIVVDYWKRPTGGKLKVKIDGQEVGVLDQEVNRGEYLWQFNWTSPTLTDGPHSVILRHGNYYNYVSIDALVVGDTVYDIGCCGMVGPITFSGFHPAMWYPYYDTRAYGNYWMRGVQGGDATFNFTGTQFSIIFNQTPYDNKDVNGHDAEIYPGTLQVIIDGVTYYNNQYMNPAALKDNNRQEADYFVYNQEWRSPQLPNGHHTVTLEADTRPLKQVGFDAISVADYSASPAEGNYSWRVLAGGYNGYSSQGCPTNYFTIGRPQLQLKNLILRNRSGAVVNPGSGGSNSVCNDFPQGRVTFDTTLTSTTGGGGSEISKVYIGLYQGGVLKMSAMAEGLDSGNITQSITGSGASFAGGVTTSVSGNDRLVSFPVIYTGFPLATYEVKVYGYISKGIWMSATPPRFLVFDQCSPAWWQVKDSDIQSSTDLISSVPANNYFGLPGLGGFPGVPAYAGATNLTGATASSLGWLANSTPIGLKVYDYAFFANQIPEDILGIMNSVDTGDVSGSLTSSGTPDANGYYWYKYDGTVSSGQPLTIPATDIGDRKVILMVDHANVNIIGNINLTDGQGFFMLVTSGGITVDPTVGGGTAPNMEGLYFANGAFDDGIGDTQLWVRGSLVANGGVTMQRDLGEGSNDPSEFFEYAPDQIMLFPKVFGYRRINWKEVAP